MNRQAWVWLLLGIHFLSKSFPFTFQAQGKWNLPNPGNMYGCQNSEEEIYATWCVWQGDIGTYNLLTMETDVGSPWVPR